MTTDNLPHPSTEEWHRYWPSALADATALADQAAMLRGQERRAHLGRAITILSQVLAGGVPEGPLRPKFLRAFHRARAAVKAITGRRRLLYRLADDYEPTTNRSPGRKPTLGWK